MLLYFGCCQEAASVYFKILYVAMIFLYKESKSLLSLFGYFIFLTSACSSTWLLDLVKENNFTFLFSLSFL